MMQIPLYCSRCGSQSNHTKTTYPGTSVCAIATICDDCGHDKVTSVTHTVTTQYDGLQCVEQRMPRDTF
jgi:hypothetical protein